MTRQDYQRWCQLVYNPLIYRQEGKLFSEDGACLHLRRSDESLCPFLKVKVLVTQSCPTLCNPMDCSLPTPLSMGFPRQECWSGLPFPSSLIVSYWRYSDFKAHLPPNAIDEATETEILEDLAKNTAVFICQGSVTQTPQLTGLNNWNVFSVFS